MSMWKQCMPVKYTIVNKIITKYEICASNYPNNWRKPKNPYHYHIERES